MDLLDLRKLIIQYGNKQRVQKGFISKLIYTENSYFQYTSLSGSIELYQNDKLFHKIGKTLGNLALELNIEDDILYFYLQVIKKDLELDYNFKNLLD